MQTNASQDGDSDTLTSQTTTLVSEPSTPSLTTGAWNGTQTDVPGVTDGNGGLSEEAKWLLVAAGIVVGVLLLAIAVCMAARWYFHGGNRRRRAKEKEEATLRRREMNDEDLEKGHVSRGSPGLPLGDNDTDEELANHKETEKKLSHHEGSGGAFSARSASSSPKRAAQQRESEGNKASSAVIWEDGPANKNSSYSTNHKDPSSVVFVEVSDPADVLAPIDPCLFKSLYEGDEEGSPLPDKREASWMETAEERQRQKEKQQRAGRKSASQHKFEKYLRANREKLRAQQQRALSSPDTALHGGSTTGLKNIVTDVRHHKNLQFLSSVDSDESSESSSDESNHNTTLPTNRAEAERMRIDDLNSKVVERRRIEEYFKAAHPVYRFQDPSRVASKALLSTTLYRGRAVLDDSYTKEREEDREKLRELVGSDVPWGNRASSVGPLKHTDDSVGPSPVARLQDLPWMTSERVRAVAKEHRRNDRLQLKKQSSIAPYVTEDGRIDYLTESTTNGGGGGGREGGEGGGARLTISDRASSFRDRASSVALGGAARRRRGASEAGGSSIRMNSRASAIVRGNFLNGGAHAGETSSHHSLGRSYTNLAHLHVDDEGDPLRSGFNLRNSALTADALREAQEVFGDRVTAANSSKAANSRDDYLHASKGSAVNASSGGYEAARRRKLVRTLASTDRHTHTNETRSEASGFLGGSRSFASDHQLGEGQRVDNLSIMSAQQGSVGRGVDIKHYGSPLSDDDDDDLLLTVHGVDSLRSPAELTKQALVDARSLSLLRAQLTELRAGDGGPPYQSTLRNSNGVSATTAGAYHSMNEAVHRGLSRESEGDTIEQSEAYAYVRPYRWQREGDEHFFHLSPQPQMRIRRAAEVADAHFVEGLESVAARLEEAEASYYAAREERRQRLVAKRRMIGIEVAEDESLSDLSEFSAVDGASLSSDHGAVGGGVHVRRAAPVSVRENAKGVTIFRAFASPHNDPYLNML